MVDNFEQIRDMLEFRSQDDFYFLQILQRKKDHKKGKVNGCNNNSRLIKAYYVHSLEHFDFIKPEVIELCKLFNARAGFNLNRRGYRKMALQNLKRMTDQLLNEDYNKAHATYNTVCGAFNHDTDKKWIIDLDGDEENNVDFVRQIIIHTSACLPDIGTSKIICSIQSKNGAHLIVKPFNLKDFNKEFPGVEIHKNTPTNLFIP